MRLRCVTLGEQRDRILLPYAALPAEIRDSRFISATPCARLPKLGQRMTVIKSSKGEPRRTYLQLIGAACLLVVVISHIFEVLHVLASMGWGNNKSVGHYLDLVSVLLGLTFLPAGYLLRSLTEVQPDHCEQNCSLATEAFSRCFAFPGGEYGCWDSWRRSAPKYAHGPTKPVDMTTRILLVGEKASVSQPSATCESGQLGRLVSLSALAVVRNRSKGVPI